MAAVDTHWGGRLEKDSREHTHSSERGIEAESTRGVMKEKRDNAEDETKVRQVRVCLSGKISQSITHVFPLHTYTHSHNDQLPLSRTQPSCCVFDVWLPAGRRYKTALFVRLFLFIHLLFCVTCTHTNTRTHSHALPQIGISCRWISRAFRSQQGVHWKKTEWAVEDIRSSFLPLYSPGPVLIIEVPFGRSLNPGLRNNTLWAESV